MTRVFAIVLVVSALLSATVLLQNRHVDAQARDYQLTVRNITNEQPISPPVVVVHESNALSLPTNAERWAGFEEFAESGAKETLIETLRGRRGVKSVTEFGGIIYPQGQQTIFSNLQAEPGDHISVIGMLWCTNDAITVGTAVITEPNSPAFGSGVVYDAGTEDNDGARESIPCFDGEGVSEPDTADGEGKIAPHPGIEGSKDLGDIFGWDRTVMEIVVDRPGTTPKRSFEVGATLENNTLGQPIKSPIVVVHDKNVDVISYRRPKELPGIDRFSEGGDVAILLDTLAKRPGVVSVSQWSIGRQIPPGASYSNNARVFVGTSVTLLGMFACTNDAYIVASAEVVGSSIQIQKTSDVATVFDSGAEDNDETAETVFCLGGAEAGFSEGIGENSRSEHPNIQGGADLNPSLHGWTADRTATLSLHEKVEVTPEPEPEPTVEPIATMVPEDELPETGGSSLSAMWWGLGLILGLSAAFVALWFLRLSNRRDSVDRR